MDRNEVAARAQTLARHCIAYRIRALSRVITNLYDSVLKPFGITVNQTTILAMLVVAGETGPGVIGKRLVMEKSTVSRSLERMSKNGWIEVATREDGSGQVIKVTPEGLGLLAGLYPEWERAQATAARYLGDEGVAAVHTLHESVERTSGAA